MGLRLGGAARLLRGRGADGLLQVVERPPRCPLLSSTVCEWRAATAGAVTPSAEASDNARVCRLARPAMLRATAEKRGLKRRRDSHRTCDSLRGKPRAPRIERPRVRSRERIYAKDNCAAWAHLRRGAPWSLKRRTPLRAGQASVAW